MPQEIYASVRVELSDNPRQTADVLARFAKAWADMLEQLGIEVQASLTINDTRTRTTRGPRKPTLVLGLKPKPPGGEAA